MAEYHDRVDILDPGTGAAVGRCDGPDERGVCSEVAAHGVVACAGCRIAPTSARPEYWLLWVPPGSHHCPLAWQLEAAY
jgi:hypothetical protein